MVQNVSLINQIATSSAQDASGRNRVVSAIAQASARTGVDFAYLLAEAKQESGLNATAKASTSSATGLFQFIDQTWLKTVKLHGGEHGLSNLADKITINSEGMAQVSNAADKKAILALRTNPEVASIMAAELASDNQASLQRTVGGDVGATDMYMAHFLGAGGASRFLKTMKDSPNAKAAEILPAAASANRSVFYDNKTGRARSVSEVYAFFDKKFEGGSDISSSVRMASASLPDQEENLAVATDMALSSLHLTSYENYSLGKGIQIGAATSTPFATMLLSQMDMESFALDTLSKVQSYGDEGDRNKKSAIATLSGTV